MSGLLDPPAPPAPFRDIRNQRPAVADEKATLCLILRRLVLKPPASVINGSVNLTRSWLATQKDAKSVLASPRSSVGDLSRAIVTMRGFDTGA